MKSFNQTSTDFTTISGDASATNLAFGKSMINQGIHHILSLSDWNFNKDSKDYTTVAATQDYNAPYNCLKVEFVRVYYGSLWYTPTEIRTGEEWSKLNNTTVSGDIPYFWYVSNRTRKISLFPIPSTGGATMRVGFTKKQRDFSVADYTTGTLTTVLNSAAITGAGVAWTASMIGRGLKITSTATILGDFWFEILTIPTALTMTIRELTPAVVAGASYTISEMIPFLDGFEDIPLYYALEKYYQMRIQPVQAREYERMWRDGVQEMLGRDQRSATGILEKQTPLQVVNPNSNPWSITIT